MRGCLAHVLMLTWEPLKLSIAKDNSLPNSPESGAFDRLAKVFAGHFDRDTHFRQS